MDLADIARITATLPDRYASRVDPDTARHLRSFAEAGETPDLLHLLVVVLREDRATITAAERDELAALLAACDMPTTDLQQLSVTG